MESERTMGVERREAMAVPFSRKAQPAGAMRVAESAPVPRLWQAFVHGWLLVFGFVIWELLKLPLELPRLAAVLLGLVPLAGLYLWLTLRVSLASLDLTQVGRKPAPVRPLLLLAAMAALVTGLVLLVPNSGAWWLFMYVTVAAGLALPPPQAAGAIAGLVGLALSCAWLTTGRFETELLVQVAFGVIASAVRELTITVGQLRAAREELARAAVVEERLRFARDLHDLLGHSLSVIVLKSELAGRLLPASPNRAATEVSDVERTAREALGQVRAAVAGYRQPDLRSELAAARQLLAASGITATVEHRADSLPRDLDGLLVWAVREGVTNVLRHSRARHCAIRISRRGDMLQAEVTDDGDGAEGGRPGSGSGLAGLAERAGTYSGRLNAGALPCGGFRVLLEVPASDTAHREAP